MQTTLSQYPIFRRHQALRARRSTRDPSEDMQVVIARPLSHSEVLALQNQMERINVDNHNGCLPVVVPGSVQNEINSKNRARRKHRGRSRHRFYEPSIARFPPPSVAKSKLKMAQEMPFWRLDYNKFRRTVSSFETREEKDARWRLEALNVMPFSSFPWKTVSKILNGPDPLRRTHKLPKEEQTEIKPRPHSIHETTRNSEDTADDSRETVIIRKKPSPSPIRKLDSKPPLPLQDLPDAKDQKPCPALSIRTRVSGNQCHSCDRRAYRAESVEALGQVFHNSCFRCANCSRVLQRSDWYHRDNKFYCNPCNRKLSLQTFRR
ncbi:unnamed protein product [Rodentolepis nana]|uniref:LIM zinc-binding domain-containing protein n=1 Tax=Rodentolepis nana TaxID=102285 RepID=A0A0R3TKX8_RODNA|nr:unnamed protein product [Rodentolepis nana]